VAADERCCTQLEFSLPGACPLTVTFDPAIGVFVGTPGWLEIALWSGASTGVYMSLVPRQPMAHDFRAAFGLGMHEAASPRVDADGVALAAIQG
jgi:hypothetical protein